MRVMVIDRIAILCYDYSEVVTLYLLQKVRLFMIAGYFAAQLVS